MPGASSPRARALGSELVLAALGALAILGVRLASWSRCWRWAVTEGRESPGLYALWRLLHGHRLYEPTTQEPYSLTLYNFGFYYVYAAVMHVLGVDGERLLFTPRALSLLGALTGGLFFVLAGARLSPPQQRFEWVTLGALAFVVWFGTQFISWWSFAVRPDVWAAALALGGFYCVLVALARARVGWLVLASLVFACAWSFKQSTVWTFAGSLLAVTLLRRNAKLTLALLLPFALVAGTALSVGGAVYRENVLAAPVLSSWQWSLFGEVLLRAFPQNPWVFGFALLVLGWECRRGPRQAWAALSEGERLLTVVAVLTFIFGSIACGREGSNKNHLLEGYVACALASWCAVRRLPASAPVWLWGAGVVAALPLLFLPALQLASALGFVADNRFGRAQLCSRSDAAAFAELEADFARLPQPAYADDEVLSLPWHSTQNRYPALALDGGWYGIARRVGILPDDFPRAELEKRGYGAALLPAGHPLIAVLRARGATCETLAPHPLGFTHVACRLRR